MNLSEPLPDTFNGFVFVESVKMTSLFCNGSHLDFLLSPATDEFLLHPVFKMRRNHFSQTSY